MPCAEKEGAGVRAPGGGYGGSSRRRPEAGEEGLHLFLFLPRKRTRGGDGEFRIEQKGAEELQRFSALRLVPISFDGSLP